jgi:hypothetical protein
MDLRDSNHVELVLEDMVVPHVVRPVREPHVLYVRMSAPRTKASRAVSVPPTTAALVLQALTTEGAAIERAVIVGADALMRHPAGDVTTAQQIFVDVIRALTDAHVPFVWRTRTGIHDGEAPPPAIVHALQAAGRLCTVELGAVSMDPALVHALEGHHAVPTPDRLRFAHALSARHVAVRVLLEPLVPMLTDQQSALSDVLMACVEAGVRRVGARYLVLTPDREQAIAARLDGMQRALLQGVFAEEPWRNDPRTDGHSGEVHKRIPGALRQRGHVRLVDLAAALHVRVDILDPVSDTELPTLVEGPPSLPRVRARPQLDLFRRSR